MVVESLPPKSPRKPVHEIRLGTGPILYKADAALSEASHTQLNDLLGMGQSPFVPYWVDLDRIGIGTVRVMPSSLQVKLSPNPSLGCGRAKM